MLAGSTAVVAAAAAGDGDGCDSDSDGDGDGAAAAVTTASASLDALFGSTFGLSADDIGCGDRLTGAVRGVIGGVDECGLTCAASTDMCRMDITDSAVNGSAARVLLARDCRKRYDRAGRNAVPYDRLTINPPTEPAERTSDGRTAGHRDITNMPSCDMVKMRSTTARTKNEEEQRGFKGQRKLLFSRISSQRTNRTGLELLDF